VPDSPLELSSALLVLSLELDDDDELSLEDEESPVDEVGASGDASSGMPQAARRKMGSRVQRRMMFRSVLGQKNTTARRDSGVPVAGCAEVLNRVFESSLRWWPCGRESA